MRLIRDHRDLNVFVAARDVAMRVYELSRTFPTEERYSLTAQIRRSSRSVCANIAEAWRKRRYPNHFVSKLSDADSELAETESWLMFALECSYITKEQFDELWADCEQVSGGLVKMMSNPDTWCGPSQIARESSEEYSTGSDENSLTS